MRRLLFGCVLMLMAGCGYTTVEPGHVGIQVNKFGTDKGVSSYPLVTGAQFYNPFTTTIFQYPTSVQTAVWTSSVHEGAPLDESLTYNSSEGLVFHADVSVSYQLLPEKVPSFYVQFRSDDVNTFTHGLMRIIARESLNEVAARYTADQLYSDKKDSVMADARVMVERKLETYGVKIVQMGYTGPPRPPEPIVAAINLKIQAIQSAITTENQVRQSKAEAQKKVAIADGDAQAAIKKAEGESKANSLLTSSISDSLLKWRSLQVQEAAIQKWNGARPYFEVGSSGVGAGPNILLNVPARP